MSTPTPDPQTLHDLLAAADIPRARYDKHGHLIAGGYVMGTWYAQGCWHAELTHDEPEARTPTPLPTLRRHVSRIHQALLPIGLLPGVRVERGPLNVHVII